MGIEIDSLGWVDEYCTKVELRERDGLLWWGILRVRGFGAWEVVE